MKDTTVLFYTNNVLAKPLLHYTFNHCIEQCRLNDCELIIISQYPLTEKMEQVCLDSQPRFVQDFNPADGSGVRSPLYDLIIEGREPIEGVDYKAFVVGKLEYGCLSIMKQVMYGLGKSAYDNIIMMEQDCLYPHNYVEVCKRGLAVKDMTYVLNNRVMLNMEGFFPSQNSIYLGSQAFKKKMLMDDFGFKIENWEKMSLTLEPIPIGLTHKPQDRVYDGYCIDEDLGQNNAVMDIKHRLNICGYFVPQEYSDTHSYWGRSDKYIDLFRDIKGLDPKRNIWGYGIAGY